MTSTLIRALTATSVVWLWGAPPAAAQPAPARVMVGPVVQAYAVSADAVDGTLGAAGIAASVAVNPLIDFEAELLWPQGAAERQYTGYTISFAAQGAPRDEFERQGVLTRTTRERRVSSVLSFAAAFHPARNESWFQPRLSIGISTHFAREESRYEPLAWPSGVSLERIYQMQMPLERRRRALGAITLGAGAAFSLTRHLVLVPDLRYDYGSIGDEINNSWRAGTRVLWRFD